MKKIRHGFRALGMIECLAVWMYSGSLCFNSSDCLGNIFFNTNIWFHLSAFVCSLYKCLHCYDRAWIFDILQEGLS